ncbi:MAG TPA: hypothetical protein VJZ27_04220, partial [Aggregatilineales bacterium]|nr:hypothetical protein [Aggregatilineales bacterium]
VTTTQAEVASQVQNFTVQTSEDFTVAQQSMQQNAVIDKSTEVELIPLEVATFDAPQNGQGGAGTAGIVEQRLVELEWPDSFRVGGSGSVRLTLRALPSGQVEVVPEIQDNAILATPILLTDRYDTHDANFTARLVAPDFEVEAITPAAQILGRGEEGTWRWSLKAPDNSGAYAMTLGIDVTWIPKPGSGQAQIDPRPIWGQAVQVEANYVFGSITVPQASLGGSVIAALGFIMQIPLLSEVLEMLWGFLFGRKKKQTQKTRRR